MKINYFRFFFFCFFLQLIPSERERERRQTRHNKLYLINVSLIKTIDSNANINKSECSARTENDRVLRFDSPFIVCIAAFGKYGFFVICEHSCLFCYHIFDRHPLDFHSVTVLSSIAIVANHERKRLNYFTNNCGGKARFPSQLTINQCQ